MVRYILLNWCARVFASEKPTSWVQEEKNKRENPPRKLIDGERRENWA